MVQVFSLFGEILCIQYANNSSKMWCWIKDWLAKRCFRKPLRKQNIKQQCACKENLMCRSELGQFPTRNMFIFFFIFFDNVFEGSSDIHIFIITEYLLSVFTDHVYHWRSPGMVWGGGESFECLWTNQLWACKTPETTGGSKGTIPFLIWKY